MYQHNNNIPPEKEIVFDFDTKIWLLDKIKVISFSDGINYYFQCLKLIFVEIKMIKLTC